MHLKQHLSLLPLIFKAKGVEDIVISPGSRNAPLIQLFYRHFRNNCHSIVDERSAAYFALGIALRKNKPVVVISTSGTAALNFAPAVAEAFHQGVSLIVLTADRPPEWIDQQDNQTIRQNGIYTANLKREFQLPVEIKDENDKIFVERIVNEAANLSQSDKPGPVHINVPLREPLYEEIPDFDDFRLFEIAGSISFSLSPELLSRYSASDKILIVAGQHIPEKLLAKSLSKLAKSDSIVCIAESVSNLSELDNAVNADIIMASEDLTEEYIPDLVIYFGGQLVSKRVKNYLRKLTKTEFWYVSPSGNAVDTFQHLNQVIKTKPHLFFESLSAVYHSENNSEFKKLWLDSHNKARAKYSKNISEINYSDMLVFSEMSKCFNAEDIIFAGNSSVIRYLQLNKMQFKKFYSNRGTSGIDGCLSTAAGIAMSTSKTVYAVLGDLSFVYDSNALWNKQLPHNLKVIVVNNNGGGIFGLIDGPSQQDAYQEYFVAHHPVKINKICEAFGVNHLYAKSVEELNTEMLKLKKSSVVTLLEVDTSGLMNAEIFRNFMNNLKQ
ncbi:MAG: 2-succinyl-5-enolpyruvyl-6-hydroxy-3-cyclohexene-1-carboxylic-acid synthase [Bacteroidales bacterium]|nr:2-succinyl-5-enolpyruvyl-6-hydroxy-3-cyclohexene-1-carboxylic-acid synthase [Bacteroidales bacterium]MBN2819803.1 2-succinyl-5-enolpyruvyl-6-hydroxy-3-cyclohexene-1-carboxylic-acid synthase [Bacteroidales bacterium]